MILETERLILRPWDVSDGESLYQYAKDPLVGPIAGWPVHTGVEESRRVIQTVLSAPETYAVTLRGDDRPVGCVGLMMGADSNFDLPDTECEVGYWIGVPFWGQGLIPEAVVRLLERGFEELGMNRIWCSCFDGNIQSRRVQEKCGFSYHHTTHNVPCLIPGLNRTEHVSCITKEAWLQRKEDER